jgi:hypothetical protein
MRMILGWLLAAVAMFAVGFAFYSTPLSETAVSKASDATGAQIQAALRGLPHDGFYAIPNPLTAADAAGMMQGPVAFVHVRLAGRPVFEPLTLAKGTAHYLLVAALLGAVLGGVQRRARTGVAFGMAAVAVLFIHFGGPIWWNYNWQTAAFFAVADFASLAVGGLVMAWWLRRQT